MLNTTKAALGLGTLGAGLLVYANQEGKQAANANQQCLACQRHVSWGMTALGAAGAIGIIGAIVTSMNGRPA